MKGFNMTKQTTDITENLPTMEPETRSKVKKGVAVGIFAAGVILLIDDQVKRLRARKAIEVTVSDNAEN